MENWSISLKILIFIGSGAIIWRLSALLSDVVDFIDDRFNIGAAFGGTILLSIVTNLPELAIVIEGTLNGQFELATGNILGGIAMQTLLLVVFDAAASKKEKRPLSTLTSSNTAIIQGLMLCLILGLVIMGTQFKSNFVDYRFSPVEISIVIAWILGLLILKRKQVFITSQKGSAQNLKLGHFSKTKSIVYLIGIASAILILGFILAQTSDQIAEYYNMSGVVFGATILALVTSLPEISGGLSFVKNKNYTPIISDIFGGNSFLPILFLLASIISRHSILPEANHADIFLTALSLVMTMVYVMGMVIQSPKRVLGLGIDSWVALLVYALGICGLLWV